jgi:hypothetical protein
LKQGDALKSLLFKYDIDYAIRRVQLNQNDLRLNGTHQLFVYAADVNVLGGRVHSIKKNAKYLVLASKETGIEVNVDQTKYIVMSRDKNAERSDNIKTDNSSIERVEVFRYLGAILTHKII